MNIAHIAAVVGIVATLTGGGWGYHRYIDAEKEDRDHATESYERLELQVAQSSLEIQIVAKESRLRDIEAEMSRLAAIADQGGLTAAERQRLRQLEQRYAAIVNELEKLK